LFTLPEHDITNLKFEIEVLDKILADETVYGILAAPPCTMFSLARTTAKTPRDFKQGMKVVRACMNIIWTIREHNKLAFWALENPKGILRQFLGKPALQFDASEYGEDYNKATDLWGYFNPIQTFRKYTRYSSTDKNTRKLPSIPKEYNRDENMTSVAIKRSITPQGFAGAFFKANP
jgi:site-specific DNA-cytosine methylase